MQTVKTLLDRLFGRSPSTSRTVSSTDVLDCYKLLLGRTPTLEERAVHEQYHVGGDPRDLVGWFMSLPELAERLWSFDAGKLTRVDFDDFRLFCNPDEPLIGRAVFGGHYETEIQATFRKHVRKGMTVLDIGANIGLFTMLAAAIVGSNGHVIAVEPSTTNVKMLEASRRENDFSNVEVHCVAADAKPSTLMLRMSGRTEGTGITDDLPPSLAQLMNSTIVPSIDVDRLLDPVRQVHFMKIDIDGHEPRAMKGLEQLLRRDRPMIVSEFAPGPLNRHSPGADRAYLEQLLSYGYDFAVIDRDASIIPCSAANDVFEVHHKRGSTHVDLLLTHSARI